MQDRNAIFDYILDENPRAAINVDEQIETRIDILMEFPNSGRPGRVAGTHELVIADTGYVVAYRILGESILILRVLHGSQMWPDDVL